MVKHHTDYIAMVGLSKQLNQMFYIFFKNSKQHLEDYQKSNLDCHGHAYANLSVIFSNIYMGVGIYDSNAIPVLDQNMIILLEEI